MTAGPATTRAHQVASDYTLAERLSTRIPNSTPWERLASPWPNYAPHLPPCSALHQRSLGEAVVDHRTSWVRKLSTPSGSVFAKTYEYKSWGSRLRDFGRRTAPWSRPRVVREFDALAWLQDHGFAGPTPLVALVWRRLGFVVRATLVTTAWPGTQADLVLAASAAPERNAVAESIGTLVGTLHALGFRDRNLDLRNLLV
ncbi:MAG: hypothetical protein JNK15_10685, partial [Planctomycetes bacterium]|nr:hypothetical protein [Planctomycetota bacterium]